MNETTTTAVTTDPFTFMDLLKTVDAIKESERKAMRRRERAHKYICPVLGHQTYWTNRYMLPWVFCSRCWYWYNEEIEDKYWKGF